MAAVGTARASRNVEDAPATRWIRLRIALYAAALLAMLGLILARAYQLQVRDGARLREMAQRQYVRPVELPPWRGAIRDRHGTPLALSVDVDSIYANPRAVGDRASDVARKLARALRLDRRKLVKQLRSRRYFAWIKRRVAPEEARRVRALKLRGVGLQSESRRFYPNGELAASVIGFAGIDARGLEGAELAFDEQLRGNPQRVAGLRDALGRRVLASGGSDLPRGGKDVVLTLDRVIQFETERALEQAHGNVDRRTGWAAAIVLDPENGDILAMASKPGFDPNRFDRSGPRQWRNRIVADTFEPGSTIKPFTVAAALAEGLTREDEAIACESGRWRVGSHVIHDHKPHRTLSLAEVIKKSSNIGVSKIAFRLGRKRLHRWLRRFGFSQKSGIALPGERAGTLRRPEGWSDVGLANIAFGQGMTATVLQLARALAVLGNGGRLVEPRLVLRVVGSEGEVVAEDPPRGKRVISAGVARRALALMRGVTEPGGTGEQAALERYSVAGKTGTAQKVDPVTGRYASDKWVSSFIGLVPAGRPRLAIAVVVNEPVGDKHYGGEVAGPVFRQIARAGLRYLGVAPDRAAALAKRAPAAGSPAVANEARAPALPRGERGGGPIWVPDFTGLSMGEVLSRAGRAKVPVRVEGSGVAVVQSPGPGPAQADTVCRVSLRPPG